MQAEIVPVGSKTLSKKVDLCNIDKCAAKVICRCTTCNNYYCYSHMKMDRHDINNFEVLNT